MQKARSARHSKQHVHTGASSSHTHRRTVASHGHTRSTAFKATQSAKSQRKIRPEDILNLPVPITPQYLLRSKTSVPGDIETAVTGARLAPLGTVALPTTFDPNTIDNKIPEPSGGTLSRMGHIHRKRFFNSLPRQNVTATGDILKTQFTNYTIYDQPMDWRTLLPKTQFSISCIETPDYTLQLDTRWYHEALPRYKSRVEVSVNTMYFMTKLERDILGEIMGSRYNWRSGKILMASRNLRSLHANTNRCFQWLHEAAFRAIEIAPHVAAMQKEQQSEIAKIKRGTKSLQRLLRKQLVPFDKHISRPDAPEPDTQLYVTLGPNQFPVTQEQADFLAEAMRTHNYDLSEVTDFAGFMERMTPERISEIPHFIQDQGALAEQAMMRRVVENTYKIKLEPIPEGAQYSDDDYSTSDGSDASDVHVAADDYAIDFDTVLAGSSAESEQRDAPSTQSTQQ